MQKHQRIEVAAEAYAGVRFHCSPRGEYRITRIIVGAVFTPAIVLAMLGLCSCRNNRAESISFGAIPSGSGAFIYIAQDRGSFSANGLSVNVKDYATGLETIDALVKGDVDIAWAAEFPLVRRALAAERISTIATLSRFSDQYLFVRKDRGINAIADLRGKRIGIPRNTIVEFYLARFFELNGLDLQDVVLVNIPPPQSVEPLSDGSLDAVVTWEPYSSRIRRQLADRVVAWPVQSSQLGYGLIICRNEWINSHLDTVTRFLESLAKAEDYLVRHPKKAKEIVRKRVPYDDELLEIFWSENQFSLSLDQSLVLAMEDEARWLIGSDLTDETQVPDFLNYIYADGLKAVKPEAVNIIR